MFVPADSSVPGKSSMALASNVNGFDESELVFVLKENLAPSSENTKKIIYHSSIV